MPSRAIPAFVHVTWHNHEWSNFVKYVEDRSNQFYFPLCIDSNLVFLMKKYIEKYAWIGDCRFILQHRRI